MRINYNVSAMLANNSLANNDDLLSASLERLSSGFKINNAKDNPAGLAMAKRMNAQIEGIGVATQNANDGISVIETADGALQEVSDILHRMEELAVQAANGTMTDDDRAVIQKEVDQLKDEIKKVGSSTEFNSQPLLNGFYDLKAYTSDENVKVSTYSKTIPADVYEATLTWDLGDPTADPKVLPSGSFTPTSANFPSSDANDYKLEIVDNIVTVSGPEGFEMKFDVPETPQTGSSAMEINCTGVGPMRLQVGSNEGQILELQIPAISLENLGLKGLDLTTQENANDAIQRIKGGLSFLNTVRGQLGAYQNRLENTSGRLNVTSENMTAAYSRIMDVDMAEEMTQYSTYTVLNQAGTSVLAQANDRPSSVLQLLQ